MIRSRAIVLLAIVTSALFLIESIPSKVLAKEETSCFGMAEAIFQVPFGKAFDVLLARAIDLNCSEAMDIAALRILYNNTGGESWFDHTDWITSLEYCSWYGVSCDIAGRVTRLDLAENNLVGAIPAQLGLMSGLEYLNFSGNLLSGVIPAELGNLSNLNEMRLNQNLLSGSIPGALGSLSNLVILDLSDNQLSEAIPTELGNLSSLNELYLGNNQLNGSIPPELGTLSSLEQLNLTGNQLTGSIPDDLSGLTSLTSLDLSNNQLDGSIPVGLGQLTMLDYLNLSGNEMSGSIPVELKQLSSLTMLNLADNLLDGTLPVELGDLSSLTQLYLQENQLDGFVPTEFSKLTNLTALKLSNNLLGGPLPLSLTSLTNLSTFYYHDTNLCEPADPDFQVWLDGIPDLQGTQGCLPVIVLPGVMGSKVYNYNDPFDLWNPDTWPCVTHPTGLLWLDLDSLEGIFNITSALANQTLELKADSPMPRWGCNHIYTVQSSTDYGVMNSYQTLIENLRQAGYSVSFFSYDWRQDLKSTAKKLDLQLNDWGFSKVYLVGHSMGGLLARTYIENPAYAAKVEKVITIGSPYLGAPDMAWEMRTGEVPDYILELGAIAGIIRNSPGMMELLPSDRFFDTGPYYAYQNLIPWETRYFSTLADTNAFYATNPGWWGEQNARLLNAADVYHDTYDDFSNINVEYHVLTAANHLTTYGILQTSTICRIIFQFPYQCFIPISWIMGDGTVPINSAADLGELSEQVTNHPSYTIEEVEETHGKLVSSPVILVDLRKILVGLQTENIIQAFTAEAKSPLPYIELSVVGSTDVKVSDGTNSSGPGENGVVVNQNPGATYEVFDNQTEITLPSGQAYTVIFEQNGDIPPEIKVSELTAPSFNGLYTVSQRAVFVDVPLNANGRATLALDLSIGLKNLSLSVMNEGKPEQIVPPSSVLDAQQSMDYSMPTTSIQVDGTKDSDGFYTGAVTITLKAVDAQTSVLKTQYSLDGGLSWLDYTSPVTFQAEQVPVFYARSVDVAGNFEYPYPFQNLRP